MLEILPGSIRRLIVFKPMRMGKIAKGESIGRKESKGRSTWATTSLKRWGDLEESAKQQNEEWLVRQAAKKSVQGRWSALLSNPSERLYKQELRNNCYYLQHEDQEQFWCMLY